MNEKISDRNFHIWLARTDKKYLKTFDELSKIYDITKGGVRRIYLKYDLRYKNSKEIRAIFYEMKNKVIMFRNINED